MEHKDHLLYTRALELMDQGAWQAAIDIAKEIKSAPLRAGIFIDGGACLKKKQLVKQGINDIEEAIKSKNAKFRAESMLYNSANGFIALYNLQLSQGRKTIPPNDSNLRMAKNRYRDAILALTSDTSAKLASQIWTNYGNCLSALGRTVDAMDSYYEAIKSDPQNGMALGNLAYEMQYFSRMVGRHRHAYILYSRYLLERIVNGEAHLRYGDPRNLHRFQTLYNYLEELINSHTKAIPEIKKYKQQRGKKGKFISFCQQNRLFLNVWLGDTTLAPATVDDIHFGPITTSIGDDKVFLPLIRTLNEIRESFVTARYLFYGALYPDSFVDKLSSLTLYDDINTYDLNGLPIGLLKAAFTRSFEVLDKVARIVNLYFDYGNERSSFWDTLATKESQGQKQEKRFIIRPELAKYNNYGLFALADICIDYHEMQNPNLKWFDIRRNLITHHFLSVSFDEFVNKDNEREIGIHELKKRTLTLLRFTKSAILYAVLAINIAETAKAEGTRSADVFETQYRQVAGVATSIVGEHI